MLEMGLRSAVLGVPAKSSSCKDAITGFVSILKFLREILLQFLARICN
jgi:hypothetical protein